LYQTFTKYSFGSQVLRRDPTAAWLRSPGGRSAADRRAAAADHSDRRAVGTDYSDRREVETDYFDRKAFETDYSDRLPRGI